MSESERERTPRQKFLQSEKQAGTFCVLMGVLGAAGLFLMEPVVRAETGAAAITTREYLTLTVVLPLCLFVFMSFVNLVALGVRLARSR